MNSLLIILIPVHLLVSCFCFGQNTVPYYSTSEKEWENTPIANNESIKQIIYLIGDAGSDSIKSASVLSLVSNHILNDVGNKTLLFLGDNIYPTGMPKSSGKSRKKQNLTFDLER